VSQNTTHFAIFTIFYNCKSVAMKFDIQHPDTLDLLSTHNFSSNLNYDNNNNNKHIYKAPCMPTDGLHYLRIH